MKITFVLPMHTAGPVGGFKVVYEYANGLAERGHQVTVLHRKTPAARPGRRQRLREALVPWTKRPAAGNENALAPWFPIHPDVCMEVVPEVTEETLPEANIIIATAWITAEWTASIAPRYGRKFYLVQDYEYFMTADSATRSRMERTFCGPFQTAAISPVVEEMLTASGANNPEYMPNGLDLKTYCVQPDMAATARSWIGFPSRGEEFKRTEDAVAALYQVREKMRLPLKVWTFGLARPQWLPRWVTYHERPSDTQLRDLYSQTAVFVTPSEYEGWGLPGAEAMACGAALVSTDHGGVRAYARHGYTALLSKPRDVEALAANISALLENDDLRRRLAAAGQHHVQQFTWAAAVDRMESLLKRSAATPCSSDILCRPI